MCVVLSSLPPLLSVARARRACVLGVMRSQLRCQPRDCDCLLCGGLLRPGCPLPRAHTASAAFAYMQQQAAAHRGLSWVSGLCQGKGFRTGGRLYTQGKQGSDCWNNAHMSARCEAGVATVIAHGLVVNYAPVGPSRELTCRQPRSPTCSWTSTPRASRGATAETTPTRHDEGAECDVFLVPVRRAPGGWLRAALSCAFGSHGGKLTA